MKEVKEFAYRRVFIKCDDGLKECLVSVSKPEPMGNRYFSIVCFSAVPKYQSKVVGIDGLHALECAIEFIKVIFRESDDPEFFNEDGDRIGGIGV